MHGSLRCMGKNDGGGKICGAVILGVLDQKMREVR
jgi:hypothetical protein